VKYPRVSGKQTIEAFLKTGFFIHRIHGSHYILKHGETGIRITVPYHRKTLAPKTLNSILKQAKITPEQFFNLM
jgi:predicted RNA binding protein YcfA (HicA-like mRNA interferase family)